MSKGDVQSFWILYYRLTSFFYVCLCFKRSSLLTTSAHSSVCLLLPDTPLLLIKKTKMFCFFHFALLYGVSCLPAVILAMIGFQSQPMREHLSKEAVSYSNHAICYAISEPVCDIIQCIFSHIKFLTGVVFSILNSRQFLLLFLLLPKNYFKFFFLNFRLYVLLSGSYFCSFSMYSIPFGEFVQN